MFEEERTTERTSWILHSRDKPLSELLNIPGKDNVLHFVHGMITLSKLSVSVYSLKWQAGF